MTVTCAGDCVFQNWGSPAPPEGFALVNPAFPTLPAGALLPVKPNSQSIVSWPDNATPPLYPDGEDFFLPLQPWPPYAGWPGEDTTPPTPPTPPPPDPTTAALPLRSAPPSTSGFSEPEPSTRKKK